jgi:serine/threonine protein kinase
MYELLCGRPPFVADDPAAVVMAHIRTRPHAPSRQRADVPPALDALVLSLLEKAPHRRPPAATDVLALTAIRPRSAGLVRRLGRQARPDTLGRLAGWRAHHRNAHSGALQPRNAEKRPASDLETEASN